MENSKQTIKITVLRGMVTVDFSMFNFAYTLFALFKKADK
jgi:hypothetical protein